MILTEEQVQAIKFCDNVLDCKDCYLCNHDMEICEDKVENLIETLEDAWRRIAEHNI